ncbi:hypothetical protein COT77_01905 [Candidatus Berkelbacteria bacterium CG10_big_fil_rev_8_21_14_0_10_41_12]|uniref:Gram-positive cocci surface proteins LPxTG domain-containing protein n=1 Tax=Candidatus Berkelbacteria bacterium CG10_big_fil_rev_8_21_14_0_10_41_12 TaxID=1974513 RepID=A0A2M6WX20_9BACT|nr:MAG: hypothetical protein COT77_01905 [Candidatus Berkelbacteria bacterium CG10_big_fil_rev_8_21_14_0_10_41_12]
MGLKNITFLALFFTCVFTGAILVHAQDVNPPLPDYVVGDSATATATATASATYTPYAVTSTLTPTPQTVIDDAETGPILLILIGLSLIGGVGFILIKRHFDQDKYSL